LPFWEAVRRSKDPTTFIVLFEDAADVLGLLIAFAGVYLGHQLNAPYLDGIASILIGVLLTVVSLVLTRESRSLLMGETASKQSLHEIVETVRTDPAILEVGHPLSMYMGPEEIVIVLRVKFDETLSAAEIVSASARLKATIKERNSFFKQIFVEPMDSDGLHK
jgi:divalent metal cation (Fe/Co/Zn/Cd) transporter